MANKRLFLALKAEPREELLTRLKKFQNQFKNDRVKWVAQQSMHLTLKFLGDTPEEKIPELIEKLEPLQNQRQAFRMEIKGTGTFGKPGKPRVIWAGIAHDEAACKLREDIDQAMQALGFEGENRTFKPHLTLARVKYIRDTRKLEKMVEEDQERHFQEWPVNAFHLFESELRPNGPKYHIIRSFPLSEKR